MFHEQIPHVQGAVGFGREADGGATGRPAPVGHAAILELRPPDAHTHAHTYQHISVIGMKSRLDSTTTNDGSNTWAVFSTPTDHISYGVSDFEYLAETKAQGG